MVKFEIDVRGKTGTQVDMNLHKEDANNCNHEYDYDCLT